MAIYTDIFGGSPIQPSLSSFNIFELNSDIVLQWPTSFQDTDNVVSGIMDVNPTADGFTIRLPDATLVSPGNAFFFINISPNNAIGFNVHASDGQPIVNNITNVEGYFLYLRDNTTPRGEWGILPFAGSNAVTYVGAASLTPGFNIAGSPIEGAGTFEFTLDLPTVWNNVANNTLTGSKLLLDSMPSGVLVDGSLTNIQFTPNTISGANLLNASVTAGKFSPNTLLSLWNSQANNSLTGSKLLLDSMPSGVLVDGSLTDAQFTPNTISGNIIADGSIPPEKLIAGPFDLTALWNAQADNTLTGSKISDGSLNGSKLEDASVSTGKLAANTLLSLWNAQGADSLTGVKIKNNTLSGSTLTAASVPSTALAANTLSTLWTAQGPGTLTGAKIGTAGSLNGNVLAAGTVPQSALVGGGVTPFSYGVISPTGNILQGINIASAVYQGNGSYLINLSQAVNSNPYVILATTQTITSNVVINASIINTSSFVISTLKANTGLPFATAFSFAVFNT